MYTVAFAVGTLPHTMAALSAPTLKSGFEPLILSVSPSSVLCVPSSWSGVSFPAPTWYVRILVRVCLSASTACSVFGGILPNASFVGAKTVIAFCEFSVSTRPAFLTAVTSVESTGLALAAEATGAVAMPFKNPGHAFGTAVQALPKVWAAGSAPMLVSLLLGAELVGAAPASAVVEL